MQHSSFFPKMLVITLCLCPLWVWPQVERGFKLLSAGDLTGAWAQFQALRSDREEGAYAQFGLAQLFGREAFPRYNLDSAYVCLSDAEAGWRRLSEKSRKKWPDFTVAEIRKWQKDIQSRIVAAALAGRDPERVEEVVAQYDRLSSRDRELLMQTRNTWLWEAVSPVELPDFFRRYRADFSAYSPALLREMERRLFEMEVGTGEWDRYPAFAQRFPQHSYVSGRLYEKADALKAGRDPGAYFSFLSQYGDTPFRFYVLDSLAAAVAFRGTLADCERYVQGFGAEYPSEAVWSHYYNLYKGRDFSEKAVRAFAGRYPEFPFPERLKRDLDFFVGRKFELLTTTGFTLEEGREFLQTYPDHPGIEKLWQRYYRIYRMGHPTPEDLDQFAATHPDYPYPDSLASERREMIDRRADGLLRNDNISVGAFLAFLQKYPDTGRRETIWRRIYDLEAGPEADIRTIEHFLRRYPEYPFAGELERQIREYHQVNEKLRFDRIVDIQRAIDFLEDYPESAYRGVLEERIYAMLEGAGNLNLLYKFLDLYPQSPYRQKILSQVYAAMTADGSLSGILAFEARYPDFQDRQRIERDKKLTELPGMVNVLYTENNREDFERYIRRAAPDHKAYRALRQYIAPDLRRKDWVAAAEKAAAFRREFGQDNPSYNELLDLLRQDNADWTKPEPIPGPVNTPAEEYAPFISADGQTMLFCGRFREDNLGNEDIFVAHWQQGEWGRPELVRDLSTAGGNEAPEAMSADGFTLILFVNGALSISERGAEGWMPLKKLPPAINRSRWQADARITADGKAMLFASSNGAYGEEDIYVSLLDDRGDWGEAINLGPVINTTQVDRTPFLHPDMKTLYFCSEGHTGLGKMDIFMSRRQDENSWTTWSKPVNLGTVINTAGNDWDFKVTTDGAYAYFTISNDIYLAALPKAFQPEKVATVSGKLVGIDGRPLAAEIVWQDLESGELVQISKSDPQTGDFFVTLPKRSVFGYSVQREGYFPLSGNVDFTDTVSNVKLEQEMVLATMEQMKDGDIRLPLNNLFFETGRYDIKPRSFPELKRLAGWILQYDLQIEIMGHTDDVGEDTDNRLLSQNRANAVRKYLIQHGAPAGSIAAAGFGESQPVATNETPEGRARNRRVEIRIRK